MDDDATIIQEIKNLELEYNKLTFSRCIYSELSDVIKNEITNLVKKILPSQNLKTKAFAFWVIGFSITEKIDIDIYNCGTPVSLTKTQCYFEALRCDITLAHVYYSMATVIKHNEYTWLPDGKRYTKKSLYIECIKYDPLMYRAYSNLGHLINSENEDDSDGFAIINGIRYENIDLYLEALKINPTYFMAYYNIAIHTNNGTQQLPDGRTLTKIELLIEAIKYNPFFYGSYRALANTVPNNIFNVRLYDGRIMNKCQLYMETLIVNNIITTDSAIEKTKIYIRSNLPKSTYWSIRTHLVYEKKTNHLFATLLLSIQKLEEKNILPLAHQAMFEDMLTLWTYGDFLNL